MRSLLAYILVVPLSFLASRLGAIVVSFPTALALNWSSVWLRSTIVGIVGSISGVAAAVAAGWFIFSWIIGPGSFTLLPFVASLFLLSVFILKDIRQSRDQAQMQAEYHVSGQKWLADEIGNPWSTVAGDICGVVLAIVWFFMI